MTNGFFDLQVNGYAGVDFNQEGLTIEQLRLACQTMRGDGVTQFLPTIITEDLDRMASRLQTLADLRTMDKFLEGMIPGFHVEGPFINETDGYRGAHPLEAVRPATVDATKRLLDAGGGLVKIVTLAPERDKGFKVTRLLADSGVVVSAGHCDPSLDQLRGAIDAGLTMFTHLGNGCPMHMHRHDNIVQRALSMSDRLWLCFIADGAHVPFVALKSYIRLAGVERCITVTDAIAPAGMGPGNYTLGRWKLKIGEDMVARAPDGSHLVGSAIHMPRVVENLRTHLQLSDDEIDRLTVRNPRLAVGIGCPAGNDLQGSNA
jgi:N-acetylglucosamine-6-phosphate deacetylase